MGPTAALLRSLLADAHRSPEAEAYLELEHGRRYRLGVAVKHRVGGVPRITLVVLVDSPDRVGPDGRISRGGFADTETVLTARGYLPTRLDDGWMAHERAVPRSRVAAERRFLQGLLSTPDSGPEGDRDPDCRELGRQSRE